MKLRFNSKQNNATKSVQNRKGHGKKMKKHKLKKFNNNIITAEDERNSLKWFDQNLVQYTNFDHLIPSCEEGI